MFPQSCRVIIQMPRNRFKDHNNLLRVSRSCIGKEQCHFGEKAYFCFFKSSHAGVNHLEFHIAFERDFHPSPDTSLSTEWSSGGKVVQLWCGKGC